MLSRRNISSIVSGLPGWVAVAIVFLPFQANGLETENGWYTVDGKIVWGYVQHNDWYKGAATLAERPNITRRELDENGDLFVAPNRTEDLDKLTDNMKQFSYPGFEHNFGLWYDRRRDVHDTECRTNADVVGPFLEQPWARSDSGTACDGLPQYDLTEFNPWYFDRVREFAQLSDDKGLVFYYNFYMQHALLERASHYADFPWRPDNTIQLTEMPVDVPAANVFFDALHLEREALHRLYIRKCLDELGDFSNTIFQVSQEYTGPLSFVQFWMDTIAKWESDTGKSVTIALGATKDVLDAVLQDPLRGPRVHTIDLRYWWYQEDGTLLAPLGGAEVPGRYAIDGSIGGTSYGSYGAFKSSPEQIYRQTREYRDLYPDKAILHDVYSDTELRQFSWAFLMGGGSLLVPGYLQYATNYPADYEAPVLTTTVQPTTDFINEQLAAVLPRSKPADLITDNSDPAENWVLAVPDTLYLVYALRGALSALTSRRRHDPIRQSGSTRAAARSRTPMKVRCQAARSSNSMRRTIRTGRFGSAPPAWRPKALKFWW